MGGNKSPTVLSSEPLGSNCRATVNANVGNPAPSDPAPENTKQKGLSFKPGVSNQHASLGFTPFFDKNLRELKAPIPLTIFNRKWQSEAISYHAERRSRVDEN